MFLQTKSCATLLYTVNDSPQPQRAFSRGLLNLNPFVQPFALEIKLGTVRRR